MSTRPVEAGSLKVGNFVVIDGEPCKIVQLDKSKPGKHGAAKVRLVGIGIFDGVKRTMISPADAMVEVPMVRKFAAQVISVSGDSVQLMSMEDYSTFETLLPEEEEIRSKLEPGVEVEVWEIMGRYKIMRTR
ncbi:MAG: translation initiation factor IF-5A [Thermoprotei archaeon]|nr:MAG: translation initiation factor IF-5A [Thermoprotei archaeon]RLE92381.1 MAG: translation initiation factor IF-5A [Thermoprotei archaeon]